VRTARERRQNLSCDPSVKNELFGLGLRFSNGRIAMRGLAEEGRVGGVAESTAVGCGRLRSAADRFFVCILIEFLQRNYPHAAA